MKIIYFIYFFFISRSYLVISIFVWIYIFNTFSNPISYIISVILFTISISVITFIEKPYLSIYVLMVLIIIIRGMIVIFSYFVSLVNLTKIPKAKYSHYLVFYSYSFIFITIFYKINYFVYKKKFCKLFNRWVSYNYQDFPVSKLLHYNYCYYVFSTNASGLLKNLSR